VQFNYLPMFLIEGAAELVHGVDDFRHNEIMNLVNTDYSGTHKILNENDEFEFKVLNQQGLLDEVFNLKRVHSPVDTHTYGGGYLLLRYMAKQSADSMTTDELAALNMPALFSTVLGEEWNSSVVSFTNGNEPNVVSDNPQMNSSLVAVNEALMSFGSGSITGTDIFRNTSFTENQNQNKSSLFVTGNV
jgi:hypothetical protein